MFVLKHFYKIYPHSSLDDLKLGLLGIHTRVVVNDIY